ncbi:MAG: peptide deformylase [Pirellulales bacterium]
MKIVEHPHPTLRHKSKPILRVDAALRSVVAEMFQLMYEAEGIGLAANQVDLPYRLFIANLRDRGENQELVFINPVINGQKGSGEAEEGCLSLPGVYAPVRRPEKIAVTAYNLEGQEVRMEDVGELLARLIQHETDHLDGVLFIDRLSEAAALEVKDAVSELEEKFDRRRAASEIPDDQKIAERLAEIEALYC